MMPFSMKLLKNMTFFYKACWQSVLSYVPMFGMIKVLTFLKNAKNSWLKKLTITIFIFANIPILNSLFNCLNCAYYAIYFFL